MQESEREVQAMKLDLTDFEAQVLKETLESCLGELSSEISHTDSRDFREGLKKRRHALADIATALEGAAG